VKHSRAALHGLVERALVEKVGLNQSEPSVVLLSQGLKISHRITVGQRADSTDDVVA